MRRAAGRGRSGDTAKLRTSLSVSGTDPARPLLPHGHARVSGCGLSASSPERPEQAVQAALGVTGRWPVPVAR